MLYITYNFQIFIHIILNLHNLHSHKMWQHCTQQATLWRAQICMNFIQHGLVKHHSPITQFKFQFLLYINCEKSHKVLQTFLLALQSTNHYINNGCTPWSVTSHIISFKVCWWLVTANLLFDSGRNSKSCSCMGPLSPGDELLWLLWAAKLPVCNDSIQASAERQPNSSKPSSSIRQCP